MKAKRARGRPRKFGGEKDGADFKGALAQTLPAVVEFLVEWQRQERRSGGRMSPRYQFALQAVAAKHGLSTRTLERRVSQLRWLALPIAQVELKGQQWVIEVEKFPP